MIVKKIKARRFRWDSDWIILAAFIAALLICGTMDMQDNQPQQQGQVK